MKYLFKYKATIQRYYRDDKRVKGLVQVEADTEEQAQEKIKEWLCKENSVDSEMVDNLKTKVIPSI